MCYSIQVCDKCFIYSPCISGCILSPSLFLSLVMFSLSLMIYLCAHVSPMIETPLEMICIIVRTCPAIWNCAGKASPCSDAATNTGSWAPMISTNVHDAPLPSPKNANRTRPSFHFGKYMMRKDWDQSNENPNPINASSIDHFLTLVFRFGISAFKFERITEISAQRPVVAKHICLNWTSIQ